MNIPKHVLNCPWVGQQYDILIFCEHLILVWRLSSILSQFQHSVVFAEHFSHLAMIILRVLLQKSVWFYHQFQFSGKNTQLSSVWLLHECNNFSHQNIRVEDNFYFCTENHKPNFYIVLEKLDHLCIFFTHEK